MKNNLPLFMKLKKFKKKISDVFYKQHTKKFVPKSKNWLDILKRFMVQRSRISAIRNVQLVLPHLSVILWNLRQVFHIRAVTLDGS
jgi:hypothetical protein